MKCQNCGNENPDNSLFCNHCGIKLQSENNIEIQKSEPKIDEEKEKINIFDPALITDNTNKDLEQFNQKKLSIKMVLAICFIGIIVILLYFFYPLINYNDAVSKKETGMYEEAISIFNNIKNYKDSANQLNECNYQLALKFKNNKDYLKAIEFFSSLNEYKDATNQINECKYQVGTQYLFEGKYAEAINYFNDCLGFNDSNELREKALYYLAVDNFAKDKLDDAINQFNEIIDYKDSNLYLEKLEKLKKEFKNSTPTPQTYDQKSEPDIGMTAEQVKNSTWGSPYKINRTTTAYGTSEQWVYSRYKYIYLDDGIVTAIQEE